MVCLFLNIAWGGPAENYDSLSSKEKKIRFTIGLGLLSAEYIGGPLLAQNIWWQNGFYWGNPLDHIGEKEPFLEDDMWHFAACNTFTEFHYRILKHGFNFKFPATGACALTFITWTGIESLDALDRKGKWLFSINDEIANCLGIGFWVLKHRYPELPVKIRVGMRKWSAMRSYVRKGLKAFDDYDDYAGDHLDNYGILKVEAIYNVYNDFFAGFAISKREGNSKDNLWGLVIGYDILNMLNTKRNGWWNTPVRLVGEFAAISFGFTYWTE